MRSLRKHKGLEQIDSGARTFIEIIWYKKHFWLALDRFVKVPMGVSNSVDVLVKSAWEFHVMI